MSWEERITVRCQKCKDDVYEDNTEFVNIEEDIMGVDILVFICPKCKTEQRSYRRG